MAHDGTAQKLLHGNLDPSTSLTIVSLHVPTPSGFRDAEFVHSKNHRHAHSFTYMRP